ncbi:restriction endonuclease subunit S [Microbulbifer sp. TRSA001]|uniref:restriction endonuclease subunit S n=1 Tax=Microbulbifer sp. TRSA001 TaxID=3243381 RepID=UPI004039268B
MKHNRPSSWQLVKVGDLCNLFNGRAFKSSEWSEQGLPIIRIQNLNNSNAKFNYFDGELADKHKINPGDLLFAWSGTPGTSFGAHEWKAATAALNQHIFKVSYNKKFINKIFLRYAINQTLDILIDGAHGGVGLRHVTKGKFEATELTFPPLAEQKVIAEKLDRLLAQVESSKARLQRIPQILKRFRQAVLAAAVSGELTKEWRDTKKIEIESWQDTIFFEVCDEITVGYVGKMSDKYTESGIPFLRSQNIRPFRFSEKNLLYISEEFHQKIIKSRLEKGDLAIVRSGAPGTTCVIPKNLGVANCSDLVIARPGNRLISGFGCIFMNSEVAQRNVAANQVGVAQQHFNVRSMKEMPILLPSTEEQKEIVQQVEHLFAYADKIEQQVNSALAKVEQLSQSILAKAFRGELTEQWRRDNPDLISGDNSAAALLARIQAERAAAKPAPRKRRKTTAA